MKRPPITVTRPDLPPLEALVPELEAIWSSGVLTNGGACHRRLEGELSTCLGAPHVSLFNNATIALMVACRALGLRGEVITTPFSFVATANSIAWAGLKPVFVDVTPGGFNIDPDQIEAAITPLTSAVMAVHCYGYACDTASISVLAERHKLAVIYDAAHAFGIRGNGTSLLAHGDISVVSFHATKVFNTFEGGLIVSRSREIKERVDSLRNFGLTATGDVEVAGVNGKMSEFNAALGIMQLPRLADAVQRRRAVDSHYRSRLSSVPGLRLPCPGPEWEHNYSYFPILVEREFPVSRDQLDASLQAKGIICRKYFHPLISDMTAYCNSASSRSHGGLPVARQVASTVLCLPIYPSLADADVDWICDEISSIGG